MGRVTLRQVAAHAGVGLATASRALRGERSVAAATRQRVEAASRALGYVPDPGMSRLIAHRWASRRPVDVVNLGLIMQASADRPGTQPALLVALKASVAERGYRLLPVDLDKFASARALSVGVRELGIQGLVVPAFEKPPRPAIDALLAEFPAVAIGSSAYRAACPLIIPDDAHSVQISLDALEQAGYERIGIALPQYFAAESEDLWLGAALARRYRRPALYPIPLLTYREDKADELPAWVREHRPDCLLVLNSSAVRLLVKDGIDIPGQVALAAIRVWEGEIDQSLSGLWTPRQRLVRSALDLLSGLVRSGTPGKTMAALTELVAAEWIAGRTLLPIGTKPRGRVALGPDGSLHWTVKPNRRVH